MCFSNGKIDKRALTAVAKAQGESRSSSPEVVEKAAEPIVESEKKALDAAFYANDLYASSTSTPVIPPPIYMSSASSSEKKLASGDSAILEKQGNEWDGYQDDDLPEKTQGHYLRNLRHQIFSLYRRLFGIVFVVNMAILIWTLVRKQKADAQHLGLIVVSNLFCAILMRQDYVINAFFTVACAVPSSCVNMSPALNHSV